MKDVKLKIELTDYNSDSYNDYGTITKVNGELLPFRNMDRATILEQVLNHLGYTVDVIENQ